MKFVMYKEDFLIPENGTFHLIPITKSDFCPKSHSHRRPGRLLLRVREGSSLGSLNMSPLRLWILSTARLRKRARQLGLGLQTEN